MLDKGLRTAPTSAAVPARNRIAGLARRSGTNLPSTNGVTRDVHHRRGSARCVPRRLPLGGPALGACPRASACVPARQHAGVAHGGHRPLVAPLAVLAGGRSEWAWPKPAGRFQIRPTGSRMVEIPGDRGPTMNDSTQDSQGRGGPGTTSDMTADPTTGLAAEPAEPA